MKFYPIRDLVLLEAKITKVTPKGMILPEASWAINYSAPFRVAAISATETLLKVGDEVLLQNRPVGKPSEVLFKVPGDEKDYILFSIFDIAGIVK